MLKKIYLMSLVLSLALSVSVFAGPDWSGPTGDWGDGAKWSGGTPPTSADTPGIYRGTSNYPVITGAATVNELYIGIAGTDGRVDMTGGTLTTASAIVVGVNGAFYGELSISGGTAALGGHLYISNYGTATGLVDLSGDASMTLNTLAMAYSTVTLGMQLNISGNATISMAAQWIDTTGKALIDISDNGTYIVAGDQVAIINLYEATEIGRASCRERV